MPSLSKLNVKFSSKTQKPNSSSQKKNISRTFIQAHAEARQS
jgi:hypothetical protein